MTLTLFLYNLLFTATAWYRLLPDVRLTREVKGEAAERLQNCFSPGVVSIKENKDGEKVATIKDARYDMSNRNVYKYEDLKDAVIISKVQDHFICKYTRHRYF